MKSFSSTFFQKGGADPTPRSVGRAPQSAKLPPPRKLNSWSILGSGPKMLAGALLPSVRSLINYGRDS